MSSYARLLAALFVSTLSFGQTQIVLQQSKYSAPGAGSVVRSGQAKLSEMVSVKDYGAVADGITDDLPAIKRAFAAVAGQGQRLFFPAGTYMVSDTVVIPNKTQIYGVGRGDADFVNTVIRALPNFPAQGTLVQMGSAPGPNFGVQVQNITLDGANVAGVCLSNSYAEELSYGKDLLLTNCGKVGLLISTNGAQNSGPFENLEIYPGTGPGVNANTICIEVTQTSSFRGISGVTCNAVNYSVRPNVAMLLDGDGHYSNIHIEHYATGISLGNGPNAADGVSVVNVDFGPDVTTGLLIQSVNGTNNQNLTIFGIKCGGCTALLSDQELGISNNDDSVGWYLLGNGAGYTKSMMSGNYGVGAQIYGPFHGYGTATFGPANGNQGAMFTLWDARPNIGITTAQETAGAAQGNNDLFEWMDTNFNVMTRVGPDGHIQAPAVNTGTLQVTSTGAQPACSSTVRGTFWFTQSPAGTADHLQVCSKSASNTYSWVSVF